MCESETSKDFRVLGVLSRHPEVVSNFVSPQASFKRCIVSQDHRCFGVKQSVSPRTRSSSSRHSMSKKLTAPNFFDHLFKWRVALESPPYHFFKSRICKGAQTISQKIGPSSTTDLLRLKASGKSTRETSMLYAAARGKFG